MRTASSLRYIAQATFPVPRCADVELLDDVLHIHLRGTYTLEELITLARAYDVQPSQVEGWAHGQGQTTIVVSLDLITEPETPSARRR